MRAMRSRIMRYVRRACRRKKSTAATITGSKARLVSASRQSIHSMTATMPTRPSTSSTMVIAPAANISCRTSTSVVSRETTRPTGFWSKKRIGSRCTRAKSPTRRSARLRCASTMVRYCCA